MMNEVLTVSPRKSFKDVVGLSRLKKLLERLVIHPMWRPDIFTGIRSPSKGLLLFGPPGTGKTLVAKALAAEANCSFLLASAASIKSRWIGESEQRVRALFTVARVIQPSIIFVDEVDALLENRESSNKYERSMKTEFFVQMDGMTTDINDRVLFIGATNNPDALDDASLRRMPHRVYLPLPTKKNRRELLKYYINSSMFTGITLKLTENDLDIIANQTKDFSNGDLEQLFKEAVFGPLDRISHLNIREIKLTDIPPVDMSDFSVALTRIKPHTSKKKLNKYEKWNKKYGMKG